MSEQPEIKSGLDEKTYEQLAQGADRVIMASSRTHESSAVLSSIQISPVSELSSTSSPVASTGDSVSRS